MLFQTMLWVKVYRGAAADDGQAAEPTRGARPCHAGGRFMPRCRMHGMNRLLRALLLSVPILLLAPTSWAVDPVVVGSKRFTESYILGEIVRQTLAQAGVPAEHKQGLGNTGILEQALASGAVDVYPEYTGTIVRELLKREGAKAPTRRWTS